MSAITREDIDRYLKKIEQYINIKDRQYDLQMWLLGALKGELEIYTKEIHYQNLDQDNYFAHYTSIETIYSILTNDKQKSFNKSRTNEENNQGYMRLYGAFSLNDPDEGRYLENEIAKDPEYIWLKDKRQYTEAFVCSFVSGKEDIGDKLAYWQSYGEDGLGCSIVPSSDSLYQDGLKRVLYGRKNVKAVKEHFKKYFEFANTIYEEDKNEKTKKEFVTNFWNVFDKIKFLHKNDAYKDEKECRYVVMPDDSSEIQFQFKNENPYLRRYILVPGFRSDEILGSGSKVIIGPRVRNKETLCKYLKKIAEDANLYGPEFTFSEIPYRKFW